MKAYVKSKPRVGRAKKLFFLFLSVSFTGLIFWSLNLSVFKVQKVNLVMDGSPENHVHLEVIRESVAPKLKAFEGQFIWQVPLSKISEKVSQDRRIKQATIRRFLAGHIDVKIIAHEPVALLLHQQKFYPIGLDGSLLPPVVKNLPNLPVLRGHIFFKDEQKRKKAIFLLENIPTEGQFSRKQISEISYHKKYGFQLILVKSATEVRVGEEHLVQRVKYLGRVLNYLASQQLQGRVIDARFRKKVVVRLRNQP